MPSVGMRRSTRIFVPKSVTKDGDLGKVLRSGKRFGEFDQEKQGRLKEDELFDEIGCKLPCYKSNGWRKVVVKQDVEVTHMDVKVETPESVNNTTPSSGENRFKNVYDRKKRSRSTTTEESPSQSESKEERMHGSFYVRKKKLRKISASGLCSRMGVLEDNVIGILVPGAAILDVVVEFSPITSLRFSCFFLSVLRFMRSSYIALSGLAAFMCCEPIVHVFARHGIYFKPGFSGRISLANETISSGFCRIFGDQSFLPSFWLEFPAAPLCFRNFHYDVFFRSLYLTHALPCFLVGLFNETHPNDETPRDEGESVPGLAIVIALPQSHGMAFGNSSVKKARTSLDVEVSGFDCRRVSTRLPVSRNIRRKRRTKRVYRSSSTRSKRVNRSSMSFRGIQHFNANNQIKINSPGKRRPGSVGLDIVGNMNNGYPSFVIPRSNEKQTNLMQRDFCHNYKEEKSTLAGLRQNIDSVHCNANILVIESDRCYREEGATLKLECSTSKVWHVVVKGQGLTKYVHQEHEVTRPSTTNRFTHALIWTAEDGWKLEFCERKDWLVFKELHKECISKNLDVNSAKTIPVPGVREVPSYDEGERVLFLMPDSYISVNNNEVARAFVKKTANYDVDPDDEEWIRKLNSGLCNDNDGNVEHLSAETFEEIIDILEKAAYRSSGDVSDENKMTSLCSDLGRGDIIAAVYQYWIKKRKQKRTALLRVFEFQPPRKAQLMQENVLRKKRSFKKQASQNGMDKQRCYFEALSADQEQLAMKRVQEAQNHAKQSWESAVHKRKRAQSLMDNADLATYLAAMALKIAETVQLAEFSDPSASC